MPEKRVSFSLPESVHNKSAYAVARYVALEAGKILKSRFGSPNAVHVKGKRNIVTEADLLSEKKVIGILKAEFPQHGILSEEAGEGGGGSEYSWIIDPLDGTNNYYFGLPIFCVNIALARQGEVVMGLTYDPMRHEMFHGIKGKGAYLNGKKVRVSTVESLDKAAIGVDLGYQAEKSIELLDIAAGLWPKIHCLRLIGSSSLAVAYVAAGRLSLYFHKHLYPWDIASGLLLVREAGGDVVNFAGKAATLKDKDVIASNSKLTSRFRNWLETR
jgi:myo-inositol-1(or 4)-monophosphatase